MGKIDLSGYFCGDNGVLICPLEGGEDIVSHNAHKCFMTASVIKTFVLAYYLTYEKDFDRVIDIPTEKHIEFSTVTELGLTYASVKELLIFMMANSDNTATNMLFEDAGFDELNTFCRDVLQTECTVVGRKMLDYDAIKKGHDNLSCASDCLKAMKYVLSYPMGREIMGRYKSLNGIMKYVYDKNVEFYGKGGSIDGVLNEIGVIKNEDGKYMFAAVFTRGKAVDDAEFLMAKCGLVSLGKERPVI